MTRAEIRRWDQRSGRLPNPPPASTEYRQIAVGIVLAAGFVNFLLGLVVQIVCYEYRDWLLAKGFALPGMTQWLVQCFCLRPTAYATFVVWSLWWPMVVVLIHCHFHTTQADDFSRCFLWGFLACGMFDLVLFAFVATILAMARILLLADLEQPPSYMQTVTWIAMLLPVLVLVYFVVSAYRLRHSHPIVKRLRS